MYTRTLARTVHRVSKSFPALLLTGPRQVGKTTLLEMCADALRSYVTLDDMDARALATSDPKLFLQTYPPPVTIDEIQYAPRLLEAIKLVIDRERKNGLFWLTGSQKFSLMQGVRESLAGRIAILDLLGLSQAELRGEGEDSRPFLPLEEGAKSSSAKGNLLEVYARIYRGSFPRIWENSPEDRHIFYRSYVQTYIQRDVKDILHISDDVVFSRYLVAVAARTGQLLNYADLARDVGVDHKTAKSWMSILQASGLVYLLPPYFSNVTKRIVKSPKFYFLDTGLCSYLTKWPSAEALESGAMSGAILETYIFTEILKSYLHNGLEPPLSYYRDTDQREIDLIIEHSDTLYPVEFKKTATPSLSATKSFSALAHLGKPIGRGTVLCLVDAPIPLSRSVTAFPIDCI